MDPSRTIIGGPLIAIETISSESAADLKEDIRQYFAAGTKAVWVIYPQIRTVEIEKPNGIMRLDSRGVLQAPNLIPGFQIRISDVFSTLGKAAPRHAIARS